MASPPHLKEALNDNQTRQPGPVPPEGQQHLLRPRTVPLTLEKFVGLTFTDALAIRAQLEEFRTTGDHEQAATVESVAVDRAEKLESLYGFDTARRWYRKATATGETLKDLQDHWLSISDYKESTKHGHRKALTEVLDYLRNDEAVPGDVTRKKAIQYVDHSMLSRTARTPGPTTRSAASRT